MQIEKNLKIIRDKKLPNTIELEITGESHTLGNLLTDTLLSDKRCTYAAYKVPHPLEEKLIVKISAERGSDVIGLLNETIKNVIAQIDHVSQKIEDIERKCDDY